MTHSDDLPYEEIDADDLGVDFEVRRVDDTLIWTCPRCSKVCRKELTAGVVYALDGSGSDPDEPHPRITVECACLRTHRDAPDGRTGCGCYFDCEIT